MSHEEVIAYAIERATFKSKQVVRQYPVLGDAEDVRQDLLEHVLRRLPRFDAGRACVKTFICRVIDNRIADLLKRARAPRRGFGRKHVSTDDWVRDGAGGWVQLGDTLDTGRARAHLDRGGRTDEELANLENDVAAFVQSLPARLRDLLERLKTQTMSEVARATGISRTCLYADLALLRERCVEAELHLYL